MKLKSGRKYDPPPPITKLDEIVARYFPDFYFHFMAKNSYHSKYYIIALNECLEY